MSEPLPAPIRNPKSAIRNWKRGLRIGFALIIIAAVIREYVPRFFTSVPRIPKMLESALPTDCRQVVLVLSPDLKSIPARMWMLERSAPDDDWTVAAGPVPVNLGRNGLAWGEGEQNTPAPDNVPVKQEGDGCSPAGVFRIPYAFGYAPTEDARLHLPYIHVTETIAGVDDVKSKYYNQVVDSSVVTKDWESNETMLRPDGLYRWGAFIAHNPRSESGRGSCIFFHLWSGPGLPTAGCTAMTEENVIALLKWLDPAKNPRLVQGLESW